MQKCPPNPVGCGEKGLTGSAGLFELSKTEGKKCREMLLTVIVKLWVILLVHGIL